MNPEKPGSLPGVKWLGPVSILALAVVMVWWVRSRTSKNTEAMTCRFVDAKTGEPVTNVTVAVWHWQRSLFPGWLIRIFPKLPEGVWRVERLIPSPSDSITLFGVPLEGAPDYGRFSVIFSVSRYQKAMFVQEDKDPALNKRDKPAVTSPARTNQVTFRFEPEER